MAVNPIPDGYQRVTPYLIIDGASDAIAYYCDVFGFTQRGDAMRSPDGKVGHAELELDGALLMLADEFPSEGAVGPKTVGGSPVTLHLYVKDVDAVHAKALKAGATALREPEDQFYGDRLSVIDDPWGHRWSIATHIEDVDPEEMGRRAAEAMSG
jgi:PhnB protein